MSFSTIEEATKAHAALQAKIEDLTKIADTRKDERVKAQKELSELRNKFDGIDLEQIKKLQDDAEARRVKDLESKGKFDELIGEKEKVIGQLQSKLSEAEKAAQDSRAASLQREKKFVLGSQFVQAGGKPKQLDNFLLASDKLFDYEVGDDGSGTLRPVGGLLDAENKEITDASAALGHYSTTDELGVFFSPKNGTNTGTGSGSNPGGGDGGGLGEGKAWL